MTRNFRGSRFKKQVMKRIILFLKMNTQTFFETFPNFQGNIKTKPLLIPTKKAGLSQGQGG